MASHRFVNGLSTTRFLFFDGTNYNYWKARMKIFSKPISNMDNG